MAPHSFLDDANTVQQSPSKDESDSLEPECWLEFRTFDDGHERLSGTTLTPPFDTFPHFTRLPAELRLKIWGYLVQPRIILISCLQRDERLPERRQELQDRTVRCEASARSRQDSPALLYVNRETRCLALRHYELTFEWRISKLRSDTPIAVPPRIWFNFALDALYLTGELEPLDSYGLNLSMVYFLRREDTLRVRHVACSFAALGYPEQESQNVFGCLWHMVDRFPGIERLLLTLSEKDERELAAKGGGAGAPPGGVRMLSADNVVQKVWDGWMRGMTVTSSTMADKQMLLVREDELAEVIASSEKSS